VGVHRLTGASHGPTAAIRGTTGRASARREVLRVEASDDGEATVAGRDAPPADEDDVAGDGAHQQGATTPPALARLGMEVNPRVFFPSAIAIVAFVAFGAFASETAEEWFVAAEQAVATGLNWWYIVLVTGLLGFVVWLGLSRHGRLRLGAADEEPEFSLLGWFTMLFSAGMGIGLLYNGVAQPLTFLDDPATAEPGTQAAASETMDFVFYHWGLHPWAVYSTVGLAVAFFAFRRGLPVSFRSAFHGLLGDRIEGRIGDVLDVFAVFGTMFGVAASLGLGARQINAGASEVFGAPFGPGAQMVIIGFVTLVATVSVVLGLERGIKRLSQFNIGLSFALMLFVFVAGSTVFLLNSIVDNTGSYLQNLLRLSFFTDPEGVASHIQIDWTMALWGWWIAWAPFVGIFIARISRGRTIREFVLGVLLVPTLVSFVWFTVFGESAMLMELTGPGGLGEVLAEDEGDALVFFSFLGALPWSTITSIAAVVAVFVFFVTSSDSGSLVIDMMTSGGHPDPPTGQRVFWAITEGAVTAVLLVAGGIDAIYASAMTVAVPLTVILVLMAISIQRAVRDEPATDERPDRDERRRRLVGGPPGGTRRRAVPGPSADARAWQRRGR
jgi:choline/glycine/proline betaine transport protein